LIQKSSELNLSNEESYLIEAFQKKENYEVFYEAKEGEEIKNFEAFRHYILIELVFEGKESFKGKVFLYEIKRNSEVFKYIIAEIRLFIQF